MAKIDHQALSCFPILYPNPAGENLPAHDIDAFSLSLPSRYVEELRPLMHFPIPELGIPRLDPLVIDSMGFDFANSRGIDVGILLNGMNISGFSRFFDISVSANVERGVIGMSLSLTNVSSVGRYSIAGTIPFFEFEPSAGKIV